MTLERLTRTEARSWFHYSHFGIAAVDGSVVAAATGFEKIEADRNIPAALRGPVRALYDSLLFTLSETFDCDAMRRVLGRGALDGLTMML